MEEKINYIFNYIKYFYPMIDELNDDSKILDLSKYVCSKHSSKDFINKNNDFYIDMELRSVLKDSDSFKSYSAIKNHIYGLMIYDTSKNMEVIDNYNLLLKEMTKRIYNGYKEVDVTSNKCDEVIELMIQNKDEMLSLLNNKVVSE